MSRSVYELYALKYAGPLTSSVAMVIWNTDWEKQIERNYYIWLIRGSSEAIVVDCGMGPQLANEKKLPGYVNPVEMLKRMGVEASQIGRVILTHLHFDHASGIELFPHAVFYVQKREFQFWIEDPIAQKPPFARVTDPTANVHLAGLRGTERLMLVDGDQEILPGVELLLAPGHTLGLQVVAVRTARGTAIVGSDCAHLFRNYEEEIPSIFITDLVAWMRTYEKVKSKASSGDLIFPGHDLKMETDYPKVAEGITRLV